MWKVLNLPQLNAPLERIEMTRRPVVTSVHKTRSQNKTLLLPVLLAGQDTYLMMIELTAVNNHIKIYVFISRLF